ncbi:Gfo/Idh/MocA family protein [Pedococcus sp. 5OH_020]|uniref:Gfo/Idh/MocA family protein n=1 Tax=Pedococcus sp. 5OH_020 TaxID=2989814 RepID=UPI0022E9CAA0|nr:Gfo/Idh/MocA family oxidoreductase [Pedococcus sp. 5OH_020]
MPLRAAVIGAGYWGPNLVRNFRSSPDWDLVAVCDLDPARAARVVGDRSTVEVETSLEALLARPDIDAVAVATPAQTHCGIALAALEAGKHVLVEKPLASTLSDATRMVDRAEELGLVLMCDHTYCYTPPVQHLRALVHSGELGDILFVDSVRINLGLVQPDVDVFWDLAPHDLSILDFVLPHGLSPLEVSARGSDPIGAGNSCLGYLTMPIGHGAIANIHVNWLSPTKIRHTVVGGSRKTVVWDDLNPQQRLSVYDRGVDLELTAGTADAAEKRAVNVNYRLGDMYAPALPEREALGQMVTEFADSIHEGRAPLTDGRAGLRVLAVLEAASESQRRAGAMAPVALTDLYAQRHGLGQPVGVGVGLLR